ncbi:hypothetical protein HY491_00425 [Candidatus Woesearchaeota archaeon]|nr:hypothetical protein [Candidatus Woesearchaeota archaeon]
MKLRQRVIGDLYLASSIIFIYLTFLYYGFGQGKGWIFLSAGMALAIFGAYTKRTLMRKEQTKRRKRKNPL